MFRCVNLAMVLFLAITALPLAQFDAWTTSWGDVGSAYYDQVAREVGFWVVDGVRVKLLQDDGDAGDAPNRGLSGVEGPGVGGSGE